MLVKYITFSFSIVFISFIVGMIITALIIKTDFYKTKLSNLNFIIGDVANQVMGVGITKWMVKNTFFKYLNPNLKFDTKMNISDIRRIRNEMTKSEISHLIAFLFVSIFICMAVYNQKYISAFTILIFNVLMNLNPSLLQQWNKRRIDRLLTKFESQFEEAKTE